MSSRNIEIILGSPVAGGITDMLAASLARGLLNAGHRPSEIRLRDHVIHPCIGCDRCKTELDGRCATYESDDADVILNRISSASLVVIACPVYFYSVPAHFKALVDRSQRWRYDPPETLARVWIALLAAGRTNGMNLFEGCLRTLKLFLQPCGFALSDSLLVRGTDQGALPLKHLEAAYNLGLAAGGRLSGH